MYADYTQNGWEDARRDLMMLVHDRIDDLDHVTVLCRGLDEREATIETVRLDEIRGRLGRGFDDPSVDEIALGVVKAVDDAAQNWVGPHSPGRTLLGAPHYFAAFRWRAWLPKGHGTIGQRGWSVRGHPPTVSPSLSPQQAGVDVAMRVMMQLTNNLEQVYRGAMSHVVHGYEGLALAQGRALETAREDSARYRAEYHGLVEQIMTERLAELDAREATADRAGRSAIVDQAIATVAQALQAQLGGGPAAAVLEKLAPVAPLLQHPRMRGLLEHPGLGALLADPAKVDQLVGMLEQVVGPAPAPPAAPTLGAAG